MIRFVLVLPVLGACRHFDSVDDACKDGVRGDAEASAAAVDFTRRVSCYRKFAGLDRGNLHPEVTAATEDHGFYLAENDVDPSTQDWSLEDPGGTGFSGTDIWARLDAAGYLVADGSVSFAAFVWQVLLPLAPATDLDGFVDYYMHDPVFRDVWLSPSWEAAGHTEVELGGETYEYSTILLYYPSGAHSRKPIVYPADEQVDVPPSWVPAPGYPAIGYPISFTFGSSEVGGGELNALQVAVQSSTITGPSGPVEHEVGTPDLLYTYSTAALYPLAPLEPNTTYTVDVSLSWIGQTRDMTTTFTTGADTEATPVARGLPR